MTVSSIAPVSAQATGCTTIPDPYTGNLYQMQKYFTVDFSCAGDSGTATLKLKDGITLCEDQPMVLQSFNMRSTWNG